MLDDQSAHWCGNAGESSPSNRHRGSLRKITESNANPALIITINDTQGPLHAHPEWQSTGEEHGHRVLRVVGKGSRVVLVPLPPAVGRAIERAVGDRVRGPILLNTRGVRMDRHAATRRLRRLAAVSVVRLPRTHPHMLRLRHDNATRPASVGPVRRILMS
jgi:hypothetical protein